MKKQQIRMIEMKNNIFNMKKQLEHVYDNSGTLSKEN